MTRAVCSALLGVGLAMVPSAQGGAVPESDDLSHVLEDVSGTAFRAHVEFLADDLLKGRDPGTEGYDLAALYVAAGLKSMGLEPAGEDGTYFQSPRFRVSRLVEGKVSFTPTGGGEEDTLTPLDDYLQRGGQVRTESRVTAPVVFVGFGVTAPEAEYDDYADLDVTGKIVALLWSGPPSFSSDRRAHFSSGTYKAANAARHGAVGVLLFQTAEDAERLPWERLKQYSDGSSTKWLRSDGTPEGVVDGLLGSAALSPAGARRLFSSSPVSFEQVLEDASKGHVEGFPLPVTATIESRSEHSSFVSANVAGVLRGSDPELARTSVVYSAHLDHVGEKDPVDGDGIYNGAFDNASGSAIVLELARAFARLSHAPARSVVFLFVTAEETGLLGSDYFAKNPTPAAGEIVANINVDMPLLLHPVATLIAHGVDNSTLEEPVSRAVAKAGLTLIPDPMPEENLFVRSDQYSFVLQGVPATSLSPFVETDEADTEGGRLFFGFLEKHYHRPSDDLSRPMDLDSVERFIRANFLIGYAVASDPEPPRWNPGDFFGETYGKGSGARPGSPGGSQ